VKEGKFKDEVVPITVKEVYVDGSMKKKTREFIVDKDEGIRADTTVEGLSKLKPVFAAGALGDPREIHRKRQTGRHLSL